MKTLALLSLVALTIATDFQMNLKENSVDFVEDINVDVAGNSERIRVPQHQDREQVDILNDFNMGLQALKIVKENICYISSIDASEQRPAQMEESLRLAHSRFPNDHYMVETSRFLPVRSMSSNEVGSRIAKHCRGGSLVLVEKVTQKNIREKALAAVNAMKSRQKRYSYSFYENNMACSSNAAETIQSCYERQLDPHCNEYSRSHYSCAYKVKCKFGTDSAGQVGYACTGEHKYSLIVCCNFSCK